MKDKLLWTILGVLMLGVLSVCWMIYTDIFRRVDVFDRPEIIKFERERPQEKRLRLKHCLTCTVFIGWDGRKWLRRDGEVVILK